MNLRRFPGPYCPGMLDEENWDTFEPELELEGPSLVLPFRKQATLKVFQFSRLSRTIRSLLRRPLFWATVYVLAIPGFAFIYLYMPLGSFYSTSLRHEPAAADLFYNFPKFVVDELKESGLYRNGLIGRGDHPKHSPLRGCDLVPSWEASHGELNQKIVAGKVTFSQTVDLRSSMPPEFFVMDHTPFFRYRLHTSVVTNQEMNRIGVTTTVLPITLNAPGSDPENAPPSKQTGELMEATVRAIFPGSLPKFGGPWNVYKSYVSNFDNKIYESKKAALHQARILERWEKYNQIVRADPVEGNGAAARMFYLSGVTITTLGHGDIMPVSSEARLIVTLQALLGVLVIGMFLNAVASKKGGVS